MPFHRPYAAVTLALELTRSFLLFLSRESISRSCDDDGWNALFRRPTNLTVGLLYSGSVLYWQSDRRRPSLVSGAHVTAALPPPFSGMLRSEILSSVSPRRF